ncbi:hypothetical protein [Methylobacterium longum]|uniref:Uncharacterized protein n=1 Tax=Methylobacterium longum TaxID=767694 RepID=A0ABT8AV51_9HYPH|nr:hypothetical protein [Methylobacterium longum]MDN3573827.1 hypothetical protein [Methylobacterium longum]GJE14959.1 hypothetical protein FOHLNKBM_6036 [Methylobacterium longum]
MIKNPVHDIETKYIRQIQRQQLELALIKAERDAALRDQEVAQARTQAMSTLVDALSSSLRPFGFDRKRFLAAIRKAARSIPDHGPASHQHTVLFEGSNRFLGRIASPLSSRD